MVSETFEIGDIVEHRNYPELLFEIEDRLEQVFDNFQFFRLSVFAVPRSTSRETLRRLEAFRDPASRLLDARCDKLHYPINEMEVLAVIWAKVSDR